MGVRTLARKINPAHPELPRRALNRYLHEGASPTRAYRELIADALGVTLDEVPDDDDEEADLSADLLAAIRDCAPTEAEAVQCFVRRHAGTIREALGL